MVDNRFLVIGSSGGNQLFLVQQGIPQGKIIIGEGEGFGASGGIVKKTIGKSLNKQLGNRPIITAKATSLGTLLLQNLYNISHSRLVIPIFLKNESRTTISEMGYVINNELIICEKSISKASIVKTEKSLIFCKLHLESFIKNYSTQEISHSLKNKVYNIEKNIKKMRLEHIKKMIEVMRIVPSVQVSVNSNITQRGNLLRITANLNKQSTQIWMRIINSKGMIVQKAGLVKKNSTGFQILVGTRDLEAGKYTVQVSNHRNFSPLGVSEFEIKGVSPLFGVVPLIPLLPLLPLPDSPDETFQKVIFRTMQDSRVDTQCKEFENKIFNINDKNLPVPPIHFNCRCHLEGIND